MRLALAVVMSALGVCSRDHEPPRGVSMSAPRGGFDAGLMPVPARVFPSISVGQELLRGNVPMHGPYASLCFNIRSRVPSAFKAQASVGSNTTVVIMSSTGEPDFSICLTDPVDPGTQVVVKSLSAVPGETLVEAEMSQELRR